MRAAKTIGNARINLLLPCRCRPCRWRRLGGSCAGFVERLRLNFGAAPSIRARQAEHMLADIGEDEVGRDRRDLKQARLAPFALDIVFACETKAAMGLHACLTRMPGGIRGEELCHIGVRPARLACVEE